MQQEIGNENSVACSLPLCLFKNYLMDKEFSTLVKTSCIRDGDQGYKMHSCRIPELRVMVLWCFLAAGLQST